jgi:hypothetical protein
MRTSIRNVLILLCLALPAERAGAASFEADLEATHAVTGDALPDRLDGRRPTVSLAPVRLEGFDWEYGSEYSIVLPAGFSIEGRSGVAAAIEDASTSVIGELPITGEIAWSGWTAP